MSRQTLIDQTTAIDDANLSKVQNLSEVAMQQLNNFDTEIESDVAKKYEQIKNEMLSDTQVATAPETFKRVENEFFPTISLKQEQEVESTPENAVSINLRGKLIIGVFASIVLLLSILLIYNAVLINRYKAEIGADSKIVLDLEAENSMLQNELEGVMGSTSPDSLGMNQEGIIEDIELIDRTPSKNIPKDSNWFNSICNFFSELFGG